MTLRNVLLTSARNLQNVIPSKNHRQSRLARDDNVIGVTKREERAAARPLNQHRYVPTMQIGREQPGIVGGRA